MLVKKGFMTADVCYEYIQVDKSNQLKVLLNGAKFSLGAYSLDAKPKLKPMTYFDPKTINGVVKEGLLVDVSDGVCEKREASISTESSENAEGSGKDLDRLTGLINVVSEIKEVPEKGIKINVMGYADGVRNLMAEFDNTTLYNKTSDYAKIFTSCLKGADKEDWKIVSTARNIELAKYRALQHKTRIASTFTSLSKTKTNFVKVDGENSPTLETGSPAGAPPTIGYCKKRRGAVVMVDFPSLDHGDATNLPVQFTHIANKTLGLGYSFLTQMKGISSDEEKVRINEVIKSKCPSGTNLDCLKSSLTALVGEVPGNCAKLEGNNSTDYLTSSTKVHTANVTSDEIKCSFLQRLRGIYELKNDNKDELIKLTMGLPNFTASDPNNYRKLTTTELALYKNEKLKTMISTYCKTPCQKKDEKDPTKFTYNISADIMEALGNEIKSAETVISTAQAKINSYKTRANPKFDLTINDEKHPEFQLNEDLNTKKKQQMEKINSFESNIKTIISFIKNPAAVPNFLSNMYDVSTHHFKKLDDEYLEQVLKLVTPDKTDNKEKKPVRSNLRKIIFMNIPEKAENAVYEVDKVPEINKWKDQRGIYHSLCGSGIAITKNASRFTFRSFYAKSGTQRHILNPDISATQQNDTKDPIDPINYLLNKMYNADSAFLEKLPWHNVYARQHPMTFLTKQKCNIVRESVNNLKLALENATKLDFSTEFKQNGSGFPTKTITIPPGFNCAINLPIFGAHTAAESAEGTPDMPHSTCDVLLEKLEEQDDDPKAPNPDTVIKLCRALVADFPWTEAECKSGKK
jgi:hypothetical protein